MSSLEQKAIKVGCTVEQTGTGGCVVRGVDADGQQATSSEWCEHKHEVREYRIQTQYEQEYKPGWKRLFGL